MVVLVFFYSIVAKKVESKKVKAIPASRDRIKLIYGICGSTLGFSLLIVSIYFIYNHKFNNAVQKQNQILSSTQINNVVVSSVQDKLPQNLTEFLVAIEGLIKENFLQVADVECFVSAKDSQIKYGGTVLAVRNYDFFEAEKGKLSLMDSFTQKAVDYQSITFAEAYQKLKNKEIKGAFCEANNNRDPRNKTLGFFIFLPLF